MNSRGESKGAYTQTYIFTENCSFSTRFFSNGASNRTTPPFFPANISKMNLKSKSLADCICTSIYLQKKHKIENCSRRRHEPRCACRRPSGGCCHLLVPRTAAASFSLAVGNRRQSRGLLRVSSGWRDGEYLQGAGVKFGLLS